MGNKEHALIAYKSTVDGRRGGVKVRVTGVREGLPGVGTHGTVFLLEPPVGEVARPIDSITCCWSVAGRVGVGAAMTGASK